MGVAALDGAERRLDDVLHDRRAKPFGVGVDGEKQRVVAQHLLGQGDEVVDVVLQLPDFAARAGGVLAATYSEKNGFMTPVPQIVGYSLSPSM